MSPTKPLFSSPLYIMAKPIGASCNLRCDYCYYLEKKDFYPSYKKYVMSDEVLELFIKQYIASQTTDDILFTWHGGEALMRNIGFYDKALQLQRKYAEGKRISNSLQTNGTLLTDEWCSFFKENDFLIGISIDGPQHCHDKYRHNKNGSGSFKEVMRGVDLLKKHDVNYNAMAVVNDYNSNYPLEFYNFFKSIECRYIQFTPVVEMHSGQFAPWNVRPDIWGDFLIQIFDEWFKNDIGAYFIQYFESTLANWLGLSPGLCSLAKYCGHAGIIEFNGDVYSCDHFVYPEYKLGNIADEDATLFSLMYSERQIKFGRDKYDSLPAQCKECDVLFACHGECPKNRILKSQTGEINLNYLCEGYYKFYKYVAPYMEKLKKDFEHSTKD